VSESTIQVATGQFYMGGRREPPHSARHAGWYGHDRGGATRGSV